MEKGNFTKLKELKKNQTQNDDLCSCSWVSVCQCCSPLRGLQYCFLSKNCKNCLSWNYLSQIYLSQGLNNTQLNLNVMSALYDYTRVCIRIYVLIYILIYELVPSRRQMNQNTHWQLTLFEKADESLQMVWILNK